MTPEQIITNLLPIVASAIAWYVSLSNQRANTVREQATALLTAEFKGLISTQTQNISALEDDIESMQRRLTDIEAQLIRLNIKAAVFEAGEKRQRPQAGDSAQAILFELRELLSKPASKA